MVCGHDSAFEDIVAMVARHDNRVASIGGFSCPAEIALKVGDRRLHANQII
jgi:hypothetical protein